MRGISVVIFALGGIAVTGCDHPVYAQRSAVVGFAPFFPFFGLYAGIAQGDWVPFGLLAGGIVLAKLGGLYT